MSRRHSRRTAALGPGMARAALAGLAGLALALALVGMSGLATPDAVARSASPAPERTAAPVPTASDVPTPDPEPPSVEFTLVAAGDVLPHSPVNASAATGDGYDYTPLMAGVRDYIAGADLALCHMEVPVAPDQGRITSYPVFGAPVHLGTGFQIVFLLVLTLPFLPFAAATTRRRRTRAAATIRTTTDTISSRRV